MDTLIYAHRGASKLAPENTMPAFELAYQIGADGIETDVQLTKDNIPVLIHDENVRRTTNGTGFVQDYTLEELQQLDAGSWFSSRYSDTTIVSLDEFLQWATSKQLKLNIELKNSVIDYKHIEKIVYELLTTYNMLDRTVISTFNANSIKRLEEIDTNLETGFLTSKGIKDLPDYAKFLGADSIHIKYRLLNKSLIKQAHQDNISVRVYTVNRPSRIMRCYKLGCDAIFTDVPQVAKEYRELFYHTHNQK